MHERAPKPDTFKELVDTAVANADEALAKEHTFTRRQIIGGIGASALSGAYLERTGGELLENVFTGSPAQAQEGSQEPSSTNSSVEGKEGSEAPREAGEMFGKQRETYVRAYGTLTTRQIQFIADDGAPLGAPFTVAPLNGIDPGRVNEQGIIQAGIRAEWLNEARRQVCQQNPDQTCDVINSLPAQTNTIGVVRSANERTSGLNADTLFDVAKHFGTQLVPGLTQKLSRIDYVRKHISENTALPKDIVAELRDIVPGLAAQESQYDSRSLSKVGAFGAFQFMPATWKDMGYTDADKSSFPLQVSAVSRFFEMAHSFFSSATASELGAIRERFFGSDEASFNKYFFVPLLVNSYNAGPGRVATVLKWFERTFPDKESLEKRLGASYADSLGYDVYASMAKIARDSKAVSGYGRDSSEYVVRSMAFAELIKERIPEVPAFSNPVESP